MKLYDHVVFIFNTLAARILFKLVIFLQNIVGYQLFYQVKILI